MIDDIEAVCDYLLSIEASPGDLAKVALSEIFPDEDWFGVADQTFYGAAATYSNLFATEMGSKFRLFLERQGLGAEQYAEVLGPIQYSSLRFASKKVFSSYRGNRGWKLNMLGFPQFQTIVVGIGHHYGDTTSQKDLGETSALLRKIALDELDPELAKCAVRYKAATSDDWDGPALLSATTSQKIGSLDVSEFDGALELKFVRNTTAKKDIACQFFIGSAYCPAKSSDEMRMLNSLITDLADVASGLAEG